MARDAIEVTRAPGGALEFSAGEVPEGMEVEGRGRSHDYNVGSLERGASLLAGGAMTVGGLRKGGLGGLASALVGGVLLYRGSTGYCPAYGAFGVDTSGVDETEGGLTDFLVGQREIRMEAVATVNRPAMELYRLWREPQNLPRFMKSLTSVDPISDHRASWRLKPPVGPGIRFVTEITHETEGEHLAWRSEDTAVVEHMGEVSFRELPSGRGTEVRLRLDFTPPAGVIGGGLARIFDGALEAQLRNELKRMKQLMETGEVATTEGQPSGRNR
jgi:uncharacterized membrane protein